MTECSNPRTTNTKSIRFPTTRFHRTKNNRQRKNRNNIKHSAIRCLRAIEIIKLSRVENLIFFIASKIDVDLGRKQAVENKPATGCGLSHAFRIWYLIYDPRYAATPLRNLSRPFYRIKFEFGLHFSAHSCLAALSLCGLPLSQSRCENNEIIKNPPKLLEINASRMKALLMIRFLA